MRESKAEKTIQLVDRLNKAGDAIERRKVAEKFFNENNLIDKLGSLELKERYARLIISWDYGGVRHSLRGLLE